VSAVEAAGVLFGVVAVWLTTRENVWCWPTGLVNVGLFIVVFFRAKLYADMGLQVVYVALCLYGWYEWLHGGRDHGALRVSATPRAAFAALAAAGVVFAAVLGLFLARRTDAALPFWDAGTTSFSLVAQAMQTRKWWENWLVWIAVDVVYVGIYVVKELYLTAGLYAVFLALAVVGLRSWRRSMSAHAEAP
jgi:nicotinamide mononucleotide transporter